jgi:hypothetical protein
MSALAQLRDPDALSAFISTLVSFNSDLQARASNLNGTWSELLTAWRDPQAQRFTAAWNEAYPIIERYLASSEDYVNYLRGVLADVRAYGE